MLRLELGIPHDLLEIARLCGGRLTRVEYLRLRAAGLGTFDALANASADDLAKQLGGDKAHVSSVVDLVSAANDAA